MKKILIALTAIVSFAGVSFALVPEENDTGYISGTSFESQTAGEPLDASADDTGETGDCYWGGIGGDFKGDSPGTISNDVVDVASRPAAWASIDEGETRNFLSVDTSDLLLRNVNLDRSARDIGNGIYVDTVVQFTASDATTIDTDAADKLVVWMQTVDHDADGDIEAYTETNLIVTAGSYATGSLKAMDYIVSVDGIEVLPGEWHRLTIKSMKIGSGDAGIAAFVVFIDGVAAKCDSLADAFGTMVLDATAAKWVGDKALFPSLAAAGDQVSQTITSLGVEGSGFIDDIAFTTTAPDFAADGKLFTIAWTDGVKSFKYAIGEGEAISVSGLKAAGSQVVTFSANFEPVQISDVVYDADNGYGAGVWTMTGIDGFSGSVFTPTADGQTGTIVAKQACFGVGQQTFDNLAEALAAAKSGDTVSLLANVALLSGESLKFGSLFSPCDVVLDLKGKSIAGGEESETATIELATGSALTIIDSIGGGHISCDATTAVDGVIYAEGDLTIGAVDGDMGASIDNGITAGELLGGTFNIIRGRFADDGGFFYRENVDPNSSVSSAVDAQGFWVVTPGAEPPVPSDDDCEITFTVDEEDTFENFAYVVYTNDTVEVSVSENTATVKQKATVKVVMIPNAGYEYDISEEDQTETFYVDEDGNLVSIDVMEDEDGEGVDEMEWELLGPTLKEVEPTTFTVTVEKANDHSTVTVVSNGLESATATLEYAASYTLPADGSYLTVTYTADTEAGYQFALNQDTEFTLDSDGDEATAPTVEVIEYAITYMYDGKEIKDLEPTSYNVEDDDTALPTSLALTGVTLEGWYDNEELEGDPVTSIAKGSTGAKTFYAKCTTVTPPEPEWDIPGTEGGIMAIDDGAGNKSVEFTSIAFTATGATVGLKAGKIDANGQIFGLVCKTDLTKEKTIVINATLTHAEEGDSITEGLFTISADLSGYTQLFVIGVGPAAAEQN